jgi:dTDP-4-amino-4,6-dideoxygalactose transaminase
MKHSRKLQWATQSFTFPPSAQGILKHTHIVDIDDEGGIDLSLVPNNTDGIIVTNIFGNVVDIEKYIQWSNKYNKFIIFDNAATAYTFYKGINSCNYGNGSVISFHHTKPFGFGEGGAIIIDKQYELECKRIINFGISNELQLPWSSFGGNYKMSEISAIYILSYLQDNFCKIVKHHISMYKKYRSSFKMYPNFGDTDMTVLSCFCLIDDKYDETFLQKIQKNNITCRKYYHPLTNTTKATAIYKKILCYPLHINIKSIHIE